MRFEKGKLKVNIEFLGRKNLRYATEAVIDTGSSVTIIPSEIADYLGLEKDRLMPKMKLITGSGQIEVSRMIMPRLKIADIPLTNTPVGIHELPDPIEVKVLIGMNVIEQLKIIIDGKNREFEIKRT